MEAVAAKRAFAFDPRVKLFFIIAMSMFAFMGTNTATLVFFFLIALCFPLGGGKYRLAAMNSVLYLIVLGIDALITRYVANAMLQVGLGMFADVLERLIPAFMIAGWAIDSTETSGLISALQNMRLPKGVIISLAVAFRFLPTVRHEFWYIKNTMKLRGVGIGWSNLLRHPLKTMEYALVPLLMRSMKIAEDLAASALTRGLDRETGRTSYREVRLRAYDYAGAASFLALLFAGLQLNRLF